MNEEIKEDSNCIIKAFEYTNITIVKEDSNTFLFRGTDIGKVLGLTNIRVTIQNFDEDERVVRKAYDSNNIERDTIFLTSRGIYRLLYNSKKDIAKQFRKWVGNILDDLIFNQGKELKVQLDKYHLLLAEKDKLLIEQTQIYTKEKEQIWKNSFRNKYVVYLLIISENLIKFGFTKDFDTRLSAHKKDYGKNIQIAFIIESKNNEMLETSFKNHEKIKFNIVSQIFNGENKTELIKLDKNLSLKNVINVLTEANKFIDTIIETDIFKKYNVNLLNYQVHTPVQELQEVQIPVKQEVLQPVQIPAQELLQPKQQVNKTIGSKCKELVKNYINTRTEYSSKRSDYIFLDDLFEDFDIWFTSNTPNTANICSKLSFSRIISSEYITNRIATGPRVKNVTPRKNAIVNRKLI